MIKVCLSKHKRVLGDPQLTLFNLVKDIERAESEEGGVYFCAFDAFGTDTIGKSLLLHYKDKISHLINILCAETKKWNILLVIGYLNYMAEQSVLVIKDGEVIANTKDFSSLHFVSGNIKISIADLANENIQLSKRTNVLFLVGARAIYSNTFYEIKSYLTHLSKTTYSAVFAFSGDKELSRENDIYLSENLSVNYYDLNFENVVDDILLDYQHDLSNKLKTYPEEPQSVLLNLRVQDRISITQLPSFPLVDMEKERLDENFSLCAVSIANRAAAIGAKKLIVGLSGGIDSASTLLLASQAVDYLAQNKDLKMTKKDLIALSMPGLGTSDRTHNNSSALAKAIGCTYLEIPIKDAVNAHFNDIGHNIDDKDVVFENAQARERTQILLDLANKYSALQLGTSDLSEAMLGWCTFSGDQCALYNTNLSFSKTQLQAILASFSKKTKNKELSKVIESILSTPISPELLPADENGQISQKTENINGPYECVDMIIYLYLYRGWDIIRIRSFLFEYYLSRFTKAEITSWCSNFENRFLHSQFKRSTSSQFPISTKIGKIFSDIAISQCL